jgi:hypothetical protein
MLRLTLAEVWPTVCPMTTTTTAPDSAWHPVPKAASPYEWGCDCCGAWVKEGAACPEGTTEAMYDNVGRAMLRQRPAAA